MANAAPPVTTWPLLRVVLLLVFGTGMALTGASSVAAAPGASPGRYRATATGYQDTQYTLYSDGSWEPANPPGLVVREYEAKPLFGLVWGIKPDAAKQAMRDRGWKLDRHEMKGVEDVVGFTGTWQGMPGYGVVKFYGGYLQSYEFAFSPNLSSAAALLADYGKAGAAIDGLYELRRSPGVTMRAGGIIAQADWSNDSFRDQPARLVEASKAEHVCLRNWAQTKTTQINLMLGNLDKDGRPSIFLRVTARPQPPRVDVGGREVQLQADHTWQWSSSPGVSYADTSSDWYFRSEEGKKSWTDITPTPSQLPLIQLGGQSFFDLRWGMTKEEVQFFAKRAGADIEASPYGSMPRMSWHGHGGGGHWPGFDEADATSFSNVNFLRWGGTFSIYFKDGKLARILSSPVLDFDEYKQTNIAFNRLLEDMKTSFRSAIGPASSYTFQSPVREAGAQHPIRNLVEGLRTEFKTPEAYFVESWEVGSTRAYLVYEADRDLSWDEWDYAYVVLEPTSLTDLRNAPKGAPSRPGLSGMLNP